MCKQSIRVEKEASKTVSIEFYCIAFIEIGSVVSEISC